MVRRIILILDEWRTDVICMGCETLHNRETLNKALEMASELKKSTDLSE